MARYRVRDLIGFGLNIQPSKKSQVFENEYAMLTAKVRKSDGVLVFDDAWLTVDESDLEWWEPRDYAEEILEQFRRKSLTSSTE